MTEASMTDASSQSTSMTEASNHEASMTEAEVEEQNFFACYKCGEFYHTKEELSFHLEVCIHNVIDKVFHLDVSF
jgi:hypothetical protein